MILCAFISVFFSSTFFSFIFSVDSIFSVSDSLSTFSFFCSFIVVFHEPAVVNPDIAKDSFTEKKSTERKKMKIIRIRNITRRDY